MRFPSFPVRRLISLISCKVLYLRERNFQRHTQLSNIRINKFSQVKISCLPCKCSNESSRRWSESQFFHQSMQLVSISLAL